MRDGDVVMFEIANWQESWLERCDSDYVRCMWEPDTWVIEFADQ